MFLGSDQKSLVQGEVNIDMVAPELGSYSQTGLDSCIELSSRIAE